MTKPTLYYAHFSPPSRACLLTAKLIGLDLNLKFVDFAKREHFSPEFLKLNPQHQIPVFVDTDGEIYVDSHAIVCFMIGKYGTDNDSLYPKDLKSRAHVDHRLHFNNGVLFQVIIDIAARNFYGGEGEFNSISLDSCHKAYGILESFLQKEGGDFMVGNAMTLADIVISTTVQTLHLLIPIETERYKRTFAWLQRMQALLPDYEGINLKGANILYSRIMARMAEHRAKANQ